MGVLKKSNFLLDSAPQISANAGLRVSEAIALSPTTIDSKRMVIRVEQAVDFRQLGIAEKAS